LIRQASPDVDFENFEKDIVKGCHCIPGLILEAASIIVHSDGIVTPNFSNGLNEYKFVSLSKSKTDEHFSGNIICTVVSLSC
jgi:hypothetical protein